MTLAKSANEATDDTLEQESRMNKPLSVVRRLMGEKAKVLL